MVDGGLAANLPILALFHNPPACPVQCLAFDLVPTNGPLPKTLDEAVHRMQDLLLVISGVASRMAIASCALAASNASKSYI
jgi:hypothetical protein